MGVTARARGYPGGRDSTAPAVRRLVSGDGALSGKRGLLLSETIQGAMIGAGSALLVVLLSTFVGFWRDRQNRAHDRVERRYDGRRTAIAHLLAEADQVVRLASKRSFEAEQGGPPMPAEIDDVGAEGGWPRLWDALAEVELLASEECATAADVMTKAVTEYAWSAKNGTQVVETRRAFVQAARRDMNINSRS